jgi:ribosomal protein S18 acetylase RimI-like enzyme
MQIRELTGDDAAAFRELRLRALVECPSAFASSHEEECDAPPEYWIRRAQPGEWGAAFGAQIGTELVGITAVAREDRRKLAHRASVRSVYVSPSFRRRGIARGLLEAAIARAWAMSGVRQLHLSVTASNSDAIALYRSAGFEPTGLEPGFVQVDGVLHDDLELMLRRDATVRQDWTAMTWEDALIDSVSRRVGQRRAG